MRKFNTGTKSLVKAICAPLLKQLFPFRMHKGPISEYIEPKLKKIRFVNDYDAGLISREQYRQMVLSSAEEMKRQNLFPLEFVWARPQFPSRFVGEMIDSMKDRVSILNSDTIELEHKFKEFSARVKKNFFHHYYKTSIFPEEAMLLYTLSWLLRPKNIVVVGSYYGYFGIWAAPWSVNAEGSVHFVDPNPDTNEIAVRNLRSLHLSEEVIVHNCDAESFFKSNDDSIDLLVLDAEGPDNAPDCTLRGKGIYDHIFRMAVARKRRVQTIACHNTYPISDFDLMATPPNLLKEADSLRRFRKNVADRGANCLEIPTTCGFGVYTFCEDELS